MMKKKFDCVAMKRRIQEKIYSETNGMSHQEQIAYFHKRIKESEFAGFLEKRPSLDATRNSQKEKG